MDRRKGGTVVDRGEGGAVVNRGKGGSWTGVRAPS